MARLNRTVSIQPNARVNLPRTVSVGPALIKTASSVADSQFAKLSDQRTQEAQVAAAAINFERDGDGNLLAPALPIGENGLIAPSIYDRIYTNMVSQRYLQQMQIDVAERVNLIASENPFDPEVFKVLTEAYVTKVTELAPDSLKHDVNMTAQVKMVEHYNHIIRVVAERDHKEARGLQLQTIKRHMKDMAGYVEGNADPEIIGAKMLEARVAIEQGDAFHFWLDDEKAVMLRSLDRQYAIAKISSMITSLPQGDVVAYRDFAKAMNSFAMGKGTFPMIDEAGNEAHVPLDEMPISPDERIAIAGYATGILNAQEAAFTNTLDARVARDTVEFFNWFSKHAMRVLTTPGATLDMNRMLEEFEKADFNVQTAGYNDSLREEIRRLMTAEISRNASGSQTAFMKAILPGWDEWNFQMEQEQERFRDGRPRESFSQIELDNMYQDAVQKVGSVPGGYYQQTIGGANEVKQFYDVLTGVEQTQRLYEDMIDDPDHPNWTRMEYLVPARMARIGIWSDELRDTIIGNLMDTEGMNQGTLDRTLRLARIFWDNPNFRRNMMKDSALGSGIGRMLHHAFSNSGRIAAVDLQQRMQNFNNPNWSPYKDWRDRDPEEKTELRLAAKSMIENSLEANWSTLFQSRGRAMAPYMDWNLFGQNLTGLPNIIMRQVESKLENYAGDINTKDPTAFMPFIGKVVDEVMKENNYGSSKLGYSPTRYTNFYDTVWWKPKSWFDLKPEWAVLSNPPENFALDSEGNRDPILMRYVTEDFQTLLDWHADRIEAGGEERPKWIAGINSGLVFSPKDSSAESNNGAYNPGWLIMLIDDDGVTPKLLTGTGLYEGDNMIYRMDSARRRLKIDEREMGLLGTETEAERRLSYQLNDLSYLQTIK